MYDRSGKLVNECMWYNGIESDIKEYEGNGLDPINIGIKQLKLSDNCVLNKWDVSLLYNLESLETNNDRFGLVKTFKIDGLNRLKTIKIGKNSFNQRYLEDIYNYFDNDRDIYGDYYDEYSSNSFSDQSDEYCDHYLIHRSDYGFKLFCITNCQSLISIEIQDECFGSVTTIKIDGFQRSYSKSSGYNLYVQNYIRDIYDSILDDRDLGGDFCTELPKAFYMANCESIESLVIGNECFGSVKAIKIDGLNHLKTLRIGEKSFTQIKNYYGIDESKSFHILNCKSLESIEIGEYSFSDFAGDFELKNLPQLQSIHIGTIERNSYNFFCSSFVIRGIDTI